MIFDFDVAYVKKVSNAEEVQEYFARMLHEAALPYIPDSDDLISYAKFLFVGQGQRKDLDSILAMVQSERFDYSDGEGEHLYELLLLWVMKRFFGKRWIEEKQHWTNIREIDLTKV
jgi:hypothetical protein